MQLRRAASKILAEQDEVGSKEKLSTTDLDLITAVNAVFRDSLKPISTGLGALYVVLAISHALVLPKPIALPMSLVALTTAITLLCFRLALRRWFIPEGWAHPIGAAISGLVLLNCFFHLYYFPEPQQTTNILLLVVGVGFIFLSTRWLTFVVLTTLSGWGIMVSMAPPSPEWLHFGFALYMSTVLSVLVHTVRLRTLTRLEMLRLQDEHRKAELETALAATEAARHEAEMSRQDLLQSEARLRLLTKQMPAVLWTTDTELHVTSSLGMGLTPLDLQPQEVLQMMRFKYSSTAVIEFLPIAAHRRALAGESVPYEISWKGHTFGCRVEPLHDATHKLIGAIGIAFDITNRKQAEETLRKSEEEIRQLNARLEQRMQTRTLELRESEEKYRVLYEANPSMYFTVDAAGHILSVNHFGAEQLGYTVDELLGQSVVNIFCEDDKAEILRQMKICLQNPAQLHSWELRKVRKDGSMLWVRETARATWGANSNLEVFIVCEDITSHKRLEEELRRYTEKLEHLVNERAMYIQQLDPHDAWQH